MFGVRHCWCASGSLLALLAFAAPGRGSDSPTAVVVASNVGDARMTRALVLVRGELSALGLDVQVRGADSPDVPDVGSERVLLDVKEGSIVVRVFAAGAQAPLVESVEADGPEVTAEVIAVRAVEALRAAQLLPPAPQRAAAVKPPPKPPEQHPPEEHPPEEHAPEEHPKAASPAAATPLLQLALGPAFVQNSQGPPQLNGHAALLVGPRWGFVALGIEGSLSGLDFERAAGSAEISRRALFFQLGARLRLRPAWELNAQAGLSYLHYGASGAAQPGYQAQNLMHDTAGASLSLGAAYYFARAVGVYLDVGGLVAFDAARVRLADESVVTLDQPSFVAGFGFLLGAL
ncbi:MAG TPA: hypothetical protein VFK05_23455 [Polyangiaceae bacterium]|nr:hypothetical protein [Polyangiaceae bacterium]